MENVVVTDLTFKESDVPLAIFLRRVTCGLVHFQSALLNILPGEHCNNNTRVQSLHSRVSELVLEDYVVLLFVFVLIL